jgi:hypothetical protein
VIEFFVLLSAVAALAALGKLLLACLADKDRLILVLGFLGGNQDAGNTGDNQGLHAR